MVPRAKEAQGRCLKGKLSQACSGGTQVEDLQGDRECTVTRGSKRGSFVEGAIL